MRLSFRRLLSESVTFRALAGSAHGTGQERSVSVFDVQN